MQIVHEKAKREEVRGSSSTSQNPQNVAFVSSNSNSSTNEEDNTAYGVSVAHTQKDLEQIDPDDLEEMDLQWEMAMLTIRARRFIKRTCRKLDVNGQRVGFDSSDSEVDSCSKSCVKAYATLKEQYDSLSSDYKKSQFNLVSYKAGLESVEARLAHYKKNEAVNEESNNVLNLEGNPQQKEYKEKGVIDSGFVSFGDGKGRSSSRKEAWSQKLKNMNKLKGNVVKVLPLKIFEYDNLVLLCQKGKQHKALLVLVIKPYNKTPYELIRGRTPLIDFMKPFGCPVTILNTRDHLGKFDGKADEGFFVGKWTRLAFDVDSLTISMNYVSVVARNQTNGIAGTRDNIVIVQAGKKTKPKQEYILIPICTTNPLISQDPKVSEEDAEEKPTKMDVSGALDKDGKDDQATRSEFERLLQQEKQTVHPNSTNSINIVSTTISAAGPSFTNDDPSSPVNAAEASNAFEEHLFEIFSPFKNAFTLPPVSNNSKHYNPWESNKAMIKDEEAASRPDIMFAVCACARFQVTPKMSHLHAVKRIFRYLKGQPKLGLWYPRDSPFDLEAFSDSDYAELSHDTEYVAAANCYG
ncbi:hypothetical protein Tco_1335116 [Tanacetum coccineum]